MKAQRSVFKHGKAKKHKHTHTHTGHSERAAEQASLCGLTAFKNIQQIRHLKARTYTNSVK